MKLNALVLEVKHNKEWFWSERMNALCCATIIYTCSIKDILLNKYICILSLQTHITYGFHFQELTAFHFSPCFHLKWGEPQTTPSWSGLGLSSI